MILGVFLASWKLKKRRRQKVKLGRRKGEIPVGFSGSLVGEGGEIQRGED